MFLISACSAVASSAQTSNAVASSAQAAGAPGGGAPAAPAPANAAPAGPTPGGGLTEQEIREHIAESEEQFRKAMRSDMSDVEAARNYYIRSALHLERIVEDGGIRNGKLFYNIGNIYFRSGDLGRAILNYRRASLYISNDPNLKQNLEYARSRRADNIEKKQAEKVFKTLFFLHYDVPSGVKLLIFTVSFAVVWIAAAILLFTSRGGIRLLLVAASVVSALFIISLSVESFSQSHNPAGVITAGEVVARKGDADTYQPSFTEPLHSGTEFGLVEKRNEWYHIELENGVRCWIPAGAGELVLQ
jgi:hypothetical protein